MKVYKFEVSNEVIEIVAATFAEAKALLRAQLLPV
jgi:hypothetical protein